MSILARAARAFRERQHLEYRKSLEQEATKASIVTAMQGQERELGLRQQALEDLEKVKARKASRLLRNRRLEEHRLSLKEAEGQMTMLQEEVAACKTALVETILLQRYELSRMAHQSRVKHQDVVALLPSLSGGLLKAAPALMAMTRCCWQELEEEQLQLEQREGLVTGVGLNGPALRRYEQELSEAVESERAALAGRGLAQEEEEMEGRRGESAVAGGSAQQGMAAAALATGPERESSSRDAQGRPSPWMRFTGAHLLVAAAGGLQAFQQQLSQMAHSWLHPEAWQRGKAQQRAVKRPSSCLTRHLGATLSSLDRTLRDWDRPF